MVSVVSAMLQRMLDERDDRPYPSTLRCVLTGGGPVPVPLLVRSARFGVPVVQTYGLTETASQAATLPPEDALHKLGSAGKPLFGTHVRIEASDERQTSEIGEILIRGPIVTPGYWDRPEESARVLRDGWLHTGDLGSLDEEGYLTVVDRREDLIVSGGENVYPAEVEAVLRSHPDIGDAGVTGIVDARWGQVPVALVVLRGQNRFSEDGLRDFCRERLAAYKVPVRIVAVESLPCTASGKLLRRELASLLPSE